jgi:hypothetical protein
MSWLAWGRAAARARGGGGQGVEAMSNETSALRRPASPKREKRTSLDVSTWAISVP